MADTGGRSLLLALGDSITAGVGGKWNKGYPHHLHKLLQQEAGDDDADLKLINWGIPGLTIPRLTRALQKGKHLHDKLAVADLIVMTIGGNDLMDAMPKKLPDDLPEAVADDALLPPLLGRQIAEDLDDLMQTLHRLVACPIYLGDMYNPFPASPFATQLIGRMNRQFFHPLPDRYPNVRVVPLSQAIRGQEEENIQYYKSGTLKELKKFWRRPIHPNDQGHEVVAQAFYEAIRLDEARSKKAQSRTAKRHAAKTKRAKRKRTTARRPNPHNRRPRKR
ncbi:MAG TPA: GDSL-type esterase/lipase family protein [Bacilli bacterium]|nr:GDSL-type esterase/lipase family protein [Bacilli bacterium]